MLNHHHQHQERPPAYHRPTHFQIWRLLEEDMLHEEVEAVGGIAIIQPHDMSNKIVLVALSIPIPILVTIMTSRISEMVVSLPTRTWTVAV